MGAAFRAFMVRRTGAITRLVKLTSCNARRNARKRIKVHINSLGYPGGGPPPRNGDVIAYWHSQLPPELTAGVGRVRSWTGPDRG
jgi:hypothetical protein